jgi:hypothetical protein
MTECDDEFVERLANRHSLSQRQSRLFLLLSAEEVDEWHSSVMLILGACLNGRPACQWLGTCSTQIQA